MLQIPSIVVLLSAPIYVFFAYSLNALTPWWQRTTTPPASLPSPITLTFVGDMMFDRYIREKAEQHGYDTLFTDVHSLWEESDIVIGNLEGPITTFAPVADYRDPGPNHYKFTFATSVAQTLAVHGFTAVSLGNNHIGNFGTEGITQTKYWLEQAGIGYAGAPKDEYTPWRSSVRGWDIAFYAYDAWINTDVELLSARIQSEATSTITIVYAHWGNEYETKPHTSQQTIAHRFVDAGADIVVGSHPHVIQSKEQYNGVWIYYSLGNFIFDQYFSDDVRCGAVVSFTIVPNATTIIPTEHFVELAKNGTTQRSTCRNEITTL